MLSLKILFVIPYNFVPPNSGNKNLLFTLLKGVTPNLECDLAILTNLDASGIENSIRMEFTHVNRIYFFAKPSGYLLLLSRLKFMLSRYHPALGNYQSKDLEKWLKINSNQYDLIHFDMIHVAPFRKFCGSVPTILVASDAYSMAARVARRVAQNNLSFLEKSSLLIQEWLLSRFERKKYPFFTMVCTVSEIDNEWLKTVAPSSFIRTIGIGVAYEFSEKQIEHFSSCDSTNKKILCTGNLNNRVIAHEIIYFLRSTFPQLLTFHPDLTITVLGKNPIPELIECIKDFGGAVIHKEFVDDYANFLDDDWIYVYPQKCGSGLQTKIQQAMAIGLPVVGYPVSFGGLRVQSGEHCFICKDDLEMNKNILALIQSRDLRRKIGSLASHHIRKNFSIERISEEMLSIYEEIAQKSV